MLIVGRSRVLREFHGQGQDSAKVRNSVSELPRICVIFFWIALQLLCITDGMYSARIQSKRGHAADNLMRIAKPMLLITTPIGLVAGVYEAFRLASGLALLMIAMVLMIGAATAMLVATIRREQRAELLASESVAAGGPTEPCAQDTEEAIQ